MNYINEWLSTQPIAVMLMTGIVAFNMCLSGISTGLDYIKDKTKSDIDNKAAAWVNKISSLLKKVIDFVGMNKEH